MFIDKQNVFQVHEYLNNDILVKYKIYEVKYTKKYYYYNY